MQSLVTERNYPEILKECELLELQGSTVIQLLTLIITDNLAEARFLIKRTAARQPLFTHLIEIVNKLWTMDYHFDFVNVENEAPVVQELYGQLQERIKKEIRHTFQSYESVELATLKEYMTDEEIRAFGEVNDGYVYPKPIQVTQIRDYNVVEKLADYIVGLRY
ncbi:hypothetical protein HDV01_003063 [Terramyces sp. JEL0728]|nr:hypothetical protein HDV01_003063 [Terramyces sp. JEL0728]